jgi:hypothetical protein
VVARAVAGVTWNASTWGIALPAAGLIAAAATTRTLIADPWSYVASFAVAAIAGLVALRGLSARLDESHPLNRSLVRLPLLNRTLQTRALPPRGTPREHDEWRDR